jgi:YebC/PmpR family DNA-binding regulatory protein
MYRKGAQDARKAKVFSKISREITVAVKESGTDPDSNTRLRSALLSARLENMPRDNVDRAIKKALGGDAGADYHDVRYEGYGPGGVAIIVEGLTDNKNRTASDVRSAFSRFGGNLGEANSVSFQFDHVGRIAYDRKVAAEEVMFEAAIEAGAEDLSSDDELYEITCSLGELTATRDALMKKFGDPQEAKVTWKPKNTTTASGDAAKTLLKLIEILEDNDDVQQVVTNADFPEDLLDSADDK